VYAISLKLQFRHRRALAAFIGTIQNSAFVDRDRLPKYSLNRFRGTPNVLVNAPIQPLANSHFDTPV
jgi:hypothetical protein